MVLLHNGGNDPSTLSFLMKYFEYRGGAKIRTLERNSMKLKGRRNFQKKGHTIDDFDFKIVF
jgi:hypothetical protein